VCRKLQIYIQDVTNIFLGLRYIIDPLDFSEFYIFSDCLVEHCSFLPLLSVEKADYSPKGFVYTLISTIAILWHATMYTMNCFVNHCCIKELLNSQDFNKL
jgi:hypothetical protein